MLVSSTRPGDLTVVQALLRVNGRRAARIRSRIGRPRSLPRALTRRVMPSIIAVAAAGEVEPGTFVVSVAVINRRTPNAAALAAAANDLEDRFTRTAIARLTGIRGKRMFLVQVRANDLLSTVPPPSLCGAALPATLLSALMSPVLHVEGAPLVPWTSGQVLRNSLGLAFRACGVPLPALLLADEVDRFASEISQPVTTTTTLPESCHGSAQLGPVTLTNPPYPDCTDVEWITPIPGCADDLAVDVLDVATGQRIGPVLFGNTTHVTFFFGLHPVRLILRACNRNAGSTGGETMTLDPIVSWGG